MIEADLPAGRFLGRSPEILHPCKVQTTFLRCHACIISLIFYWSSIAISDGEEWLGERRGGEEEKRGK